MIGAGITGLVTLKNTLEEGFGATASERRDTIGGVWKYSTLEMAKICPSSRQL
jgi:dimethylaniline monooxygenase (N-oxide forming)